MAQLQKIAETHGSATEKSSTTWLRSRGEQKHVDQLQRRVETRGSAQEESRNTWLSSRGEQKHLAQLQRRAETPDSAPEESRNTWLSSRVAGTCGSSIQMIRNPCFGYRGEQEHLD